MLKTYFYSFSSLYSIIVKKKEPDKKVYLQGKGGELLTIGNYAGRTMYKEPYPDIESEVKVHTNFSGIFSLKSDRTIWAALNNMVAKLQ